MDVQSVPVTFQPSGRTVYVLSGTPLVEAAALAGLAVSVPCGGAGTCGKCQVQMISGESPPTSADDALLGAGQLASGWRLACQTIVRGPLVVGFPEAVLVGGRYQILERAAEGGVPFELQPVARRLPFRLPPPTLEDPRSDAERFQAAVGAGPLDLSLLRQLPGWLREQDFRGTAVTIGDWVLDVRPGESTKPCYGTAFDIGTTTIVGLLLALDSGRELGVASAINPQVSYGDDVLSRIRHASTGSAAVAQLQAAVVDEVNRLIARLCLDAGIAAEDVLCAAFAGNTTMQQLFCGIDSAPLGQVPFAPARRAGAWHPAVELGVKIHPRARAYLFPVMGGFVGGDIVAGVFATRFAAETGPALMVDIGTNGEVVFVHQGRLWAAAAAAGPAFEGARIGCGMRAAAGAIERVVLADGDLQLGVIGGGRPCGICGSGLIDLAACLLDAGVVTPQGRMLPPEELPPTAPAWARRRIERDSSGDCRVRLTDDESGSGGSVVISQRDIRELQLASGAIRAAIRLLLRQAGVPPSEVKCLLLAGGFGSYLRRTSAQRIGLLPPEIPSAAIRYVGNISLMGAKWALLSSATAVAAEQIARQATLVELSLDRAFQYEFAEAMLFPGPS